MDTLPSLLRVLLLFVLGGFAGFAAILTHPLAQGMAVVAEELLKLAALVIVPFRARRRFGDGAVVGLGFGVTESVIYVMNNLMVGGTPFTIRIIVTTCMHIVSTGIASLTPMGIIGAIIVHGLFNVLVR